MKIQVNLVILSILLLISFSPQMTVVSGVQDHERDFNNNLLESEEFKPDWQKLNVSNSPSARDLTPLVYDSINKKTILFGGFTSSVVYKDTWVFDHETMNWTEMYPTNSPLFSQHGHRMVFDPMTEQIIMHGHDGTWAYSYKNNTWVDLNPVNEPNFSYFEAMVYDNINNVVLMTQGQNIYAYHSINNTWVNKATNNPCYGNGPFYSFDQKYGKFIYYQTQKTCAYDYPSNTWTQLSPSSSPPQVNGYGSSMIYDPILEQSILFGGDLTINYDTTWSFDYNTTSWTQILTDNAPSSRVAVGMTYDSDNEVVILFGGRSGGVAHLGDTWQFTPHEYAGSKIRVNNLPNNYEYNFGSTNNIVFNITTENATTYDIFLNDELINSYNYSDNDTISLDLHDIYSEFSYTNFTTLNNTIFQYSNLTLVFRNAQNDSLTNYINVKVIDNIPQIYHDTFDIDHEVGTSQILNFNVSDDNLDSLKVYQNDEQLYSKELNSSSLNLDLNDFMDGSYNLTQYNFTLSFIDTNANNANQSLLVNLLDTTKPVLSLFTADDYMETETNGLIRFKAIDPTLSNYTLMINNVTLSTGSVSSNELIEISNANYSEGEYNVTLLLLDRADNSLSFTTSFTVDAYVAPTNNTNTTETTETTETSTQTSTEVSTEVSTQTISNTIIPEEPSSDFGSNLLIIIAGIVVGLTGIELFRRQIDKNSK